MFNPKRPNMFVVSVLLESFLFGHKYVPLSSITSNHLIATNICIQRWRKCPVTVKPTQTFVIVNISVTEAITKQKIKTVFKCGSNSNVMTKVHVLLTCYLGIMKTESGQTSLNHNIVYGIGVYNDLCYIFPSSTVTWKMW